MSQNSPEAPTASEVSTFTKVFSQISNNVSTIVLGKPWETRLALATLFAEGHLLIEDVPGVGKTTIARSLASSIEARWNRVQFTPDLLPSDVTGVTIFNQATHEFEFHPGPIFANIVVADEINRASPKTQSALLEVMEEHHVTVDGNSRNVGAPFMVVATQNPVEMDGTYRLPEAQLDRFAMRISVGYPSAEVEQHVARNALAGSYATDLSAVTDTATVSELITLTRRVYISDDLCAYVVALADATRHAQALRIGVSPRGVIALLRLAQVLALSLGRAYVIPEDIKTLITPVFAHRLVLAPDTQLEGRSAEDVLTELAVKVPVPAPMGA